MPPATDVRATIDDLYAVEGKAELIGGRNYLGPRPAKPPRFVDGAPTFAVEVRSENDYGPAAEREMASKRRDYFEAGTVVVWDVDTVAEVVHVCRADDPTTPATYGRGQVAEAEPAVPGWIMAVDRIFDAPGRI